MLEGDPGTGKTRLLEEMLGRLRLDGAAVAAVRAVEADRAEPWSGVRALARGGLLDARGLAAAPATALAAFAAEFPEWAERFAGALSAPPLPPGRALAELLRSAAEEQPVFLAVDDAEVLARAAELPPAEATDALDELEWHRWLVSEPRGIRVRCPDRPRGDRSGDAYTRPTPPHPGASATLGA